MFEIQFLALLGLVGKSITSKAVGMGLEPVAEGIRRQLSEQEAGEAQKAVRAAVEAARLEIRDRYFRGEDEISKDVIALLDHPPFAEEVARRLLVRGKPDFERLRRHYLAKSEDEEEAGERWKALRVPLDSLFEAIETHLKADPRFGPLLRDTQQLVRLDGIETAVQQIAESSERAAHLQAELLAELRLADIPRLLEKVHGRTRRRSGRGLGRLTAEEHGYLGRLCSECNRLPLADDERDVTPNRDHSGKARRRASLDHVYVTLETTASPSLDQVLDRLEVPQADRKKVKARIGVEKKRGDLEGGELRLEARVGLEGRELDDDHPLRPWVKDAATLKAAQGAQSALEALLAEQRMVLLGDPGSGKSTFVNHLAMTLAAGLLKEATGWRETLGDRFPDQAPWFPLRIELRRWSRQLNEAAKRGEEGVELLYGVLDKLTGVGRKRWLERFEQPGTLVLFDGLDEVPPARGEAPSEEAERLDHRKLVLGAVEEFLASHPCRVVLTCRVKTFELGGYEIGELPVFRLAPLRAEKIRALIVNWYGELADVGRLTPEEAEACRDRLLRVLREPGELARLAETPLLLTMLAQVNARRKLPDSRAELYHECTQQLLWKWEQKRPENLDGLLKAADGLPQWRLEQALCRLAYDVHETGGDELADVPADALRGAFAAIHPKPYQGRAWAERVVDLIHERGGLLVETETDHFSFPHRGFQEYLAARWLLENGDVPGTAWKLAAQDVWREVVLLACGLLTLGISPRLSDILAILSHLVAVKEPPTDADWKRLLVAGQGWLEYQPHRGTREALEVKEAELEAQIPTLLTRLMQHPDLPAAQRLEAGLLLAELGVLPEDLDDWVEIPADKLSYPFKIAKYPVTNAQYQQFVEAGGYDPDQPWWSEEAVQELTEYWGERWRKGPRLWGDRRYDRSTQPVVGVSWYEAVAYCAWRTKTLPESDEEIRLPTEEEWARAAGGVEGSKYPWGDKFEPWRVNSEESGLDQPTPVAMYPDGASPEEIYDLAGNVWEWVADGQEAWRCFRGGSYYQNADGVGASARSVFRPGCRNLNFGFRCVFVPVSRALS